MFTGLLVIFYSWFIYYKLHYYVLDKGVLIVS